MTGVEQGTTGFRVNQHFRSTEGVSNCADTLIDISTCNELESRIIFILFRNIPSQEPDSIIFSSWTVSEEFSQSSTPLVPFIQGYFFAQKGIEMCGRVRHQGGSHRTVT